METEPNLTLSKFTVISRFRFVVITPQFLNIGFIDHIKSDNSNLM